MPEYRRFRWLLCCLLSLIFIGGEAVAAQNVAPASVKSEMQRYRISENSFSVFAQRINEQTPLLLLHPDTPRNPASTIKLLSTYVALEELGPAYTWKTQAYATSAIKDGTLDGDLYLKGYGDPYLVMEYFWRLLRGLRKAGLKTINGDLVIDASYFQPEVEDPALFDGQPHRSYNVPPSALLLNFQSINFRFRPDPLSGRLAIAVDPDPGLVIDNQVKVSRGRCRSSNRSLNMRIDKDGDQDTVKFSGRYPRDCGESSMYRVVSDSSEYIYGVFNKLWREQGGEIHGKLREAQVPRKARLIYTANSLPLSDILRAINKYSNNVMTRQLVLTLGAERFGPPGTTANGIRVIEDWLKRKDMAFPELVLENGAGLSREARISVRHMGELLLTAYRSPYMPEFMSSLPIAAEDGTLRKRFGGSDLRGRLHLKTGLIDDVRGMAGYMLDAKGRRIVVVALHNHARATGRAGKAMQESLLEWLYQLE